ncbi:MAG: hypothetical protein GX935_07750 [Erysipelotrichia bacterium]|jgi:hypothetical protein|nr:hypothetical protein [Erysipelotrichia bacterium]
MSKSEMFKTQLFFLWENSLVDFISQGVDGIRMHTVNNSYIAPKIYSAIRTLMFAA